VSASSEGVLDSQLTAILASHCLVVMRSEEAQLLDAGVVGSREI
jgi:hypothetical protein